MVGHGAGRARLCEAQLFLRRANRSRAESLQIDAFAAVPGGGRLARKFHFPGCLQGLVLAGPCPPPI